MFVLQLYSISCLNTMSIPFCATYCTLSTDMKNQRILLPYLYALITIVCTFLVGQLILWFVPDNTNIWASALFIFMNLLPMLVAFGFVQMSGEMSGIGQILKAAFSPHERRYALSLIHISEPTRP